MTNGASGLNLSGTFSGNGGGLTNLMASQLTGTIAAGNVASGSITTAMLANGAVGVNQLAAGSVTATALADGAVTATKLDPGIGVWSRADDNVFLIAGDVGIGTAEPQRKLHVIGDILASGTITGSSDRNVKRDFSPVDSREVLDKVAALPISTWTYIADDGVRHLGPMAQDFHSAFNVGLNDKTISMVDADGVALAAIQGLNQKLEEREASLRSELKRRDAENADLKARLEKLERMLEAKGGSR